MILEQDTSSCITLYNSFFSLFNLEFRCSSDYTVLGLLTSGLPSAVGGALQGLIRIGSTTL